MINEKINPTKRKQLVNTIGAFVENKECKDCNIKLACNAVQKLNKANICIMISEIALGKGNF